MTALLAVLISFSVFSSTPSVTALKHSENNNAIHCVPTSALNFLPTFTDSSFSVENQTSVDVGWINVHLADGSYSYINVTGSGVFNTTLTDYAADCSLHGQSFPTGVPTRIIIDAHTSVRVSWTANIIVVDEAETW